MTTRFIWTDANGVETELNDPTNGLVVLAGALGLDSPPMVNSIAQYVSLDGGTLTKRRRGVRPIVLPLFIEDTVTNNVQFGVAHLVATLQGPGTLTVVNDLNARTLYDVIYEAGLEGDAGRSAALGTRWRKFVVSLIALDPWWQDDEQSVAIDTDSTSFDDAATAFDDTVDFGGAAQTAITVDGDTTAYPTWTAVGPYDALRVGVTGGSEFEMTDALADGDELVIDTRPGSRGPRLNDGDVDWSLLTPASRLWELPSGTPTVYAASSGGDGGSSLTLSYRQRWLTT